MKNKVQISEYWREMVVSNSSKAFEELFYILNARLIRFCLCYVHKKEIAEEIVSDVFVNCWLTRDRLFDVRNPETYLFISVKNRALNYTKRMSSIHLVTIDDNSLELVDTYRPDLEMERKELMFKFDRAIETLPHQCKIVFRLVKEDGMKCREVADILQISTRTVHTQLYRAMKKLSSIMVDYENHPKKEGSSIASKIFSIFFL